jgi:hypothetical protein
MKKLGLKYLFVHSWVQISSHVLVVDLGQVLGQAYDLRKKARIHVITVPASIDREINHWQIFPRFRIFETIG